MGLFAPHSTVENSCCRCCWVQVCTGSLCLSALAYPASRSWYNRNWRRINQNELFEQKLLRCVAHTICQHLTYSLLA